MRTWVQLAQEQWAGQRGWSPLSWADSAAHVVRSGVQRGAVPSRPWSAWVCVCVGGDESPERNADPRARPGRPAPVRGRALRKGSGHPEECGGFPRIVVHVGTRCLREAGPEAARAAKGAPRPRRLEEGVSDSREDGVRPSSPRFRHPAACPARGSPPAEPGRGLRPQAAGVSAGQDLPRPAL